MVFVPSISELKAIGSEARSWAAQWSGLPLHSVPWEEVPTKKKGRRDV
jgi:hypothetical protein